MTIHSSFPRQPRRVTVVGAGYVGLITAVGLADLGHRIELVETRPDRLTPLRNGSVPIYEQGVQSRLAAHLDQGSLRVRSKPTDDTDVILICVGTPIGSDGRSDLTQLRRALESVRNLAAGQVALVIRSTVPPGSSQLVSGWSDVPTNRILFNPEFLRQGTALRDFERPTRIVLAHFPDVMPGLVDLVMGLYDGLDAPRLVVDVAAGELIKNGANAFLALKLSFANEIASMCEEFGADAETVLHGIGLDPRIGGSYMRPSFGFGGSCLPKELAALTAAGKARGLEMHMAAAASEANLASQRRFVARVSTALGGLHGRRLGVLGLAFKAGTDDVRESPAVGVASALLDGGASVTAYDPVASRNAVVVEPRLNIAGTAEDAVVDTDAVLITTDWPEFKDLDWSNLRSTLRSPNVFDGRRLLDPTMMAALGFRYFAVGSPPPVLRPGETPSPGRSASPKPTSQDGHRSAPTLRGLD